MRALSVLILCALVAGLLSVAAVSYGQENEHKISINLVDADIRDALTILFRGTDKNFVLTEGAATNTRITVKLDGVDFETALRLILEQAGLQAKVAGNVYTISPKPTTALGGGGLTRPTGAGNTGTGARRAVPTPPSGGGSSLEDIFGGGSGYSGDSYETSTGEGSKKVTRTIRILYADATEIATLFGDKGKVAKGKMTGENAYGGLGGLGGFGGINSGIGGIGGYGGYGTSGYGGYGGYGGSPYGGYGGYGTSSYGSRYGSSGGYGSYGSSYRGYGSTSYRAVPPPPPT